MREGLAAVILAASERGGMGEECFENKTRHLIPQNDKPLIFHLVDTLLGNSQIREIHIIIEERIDKFNKYLPCSQNYYNIINKNPIYKKLIRLHGQNSLTRVGTYEAVKSFIDEEKDRFPLLIIYGDSYINSKFLDKFINKFLEEKDRELSPSIYWGIIPPQAERGNVLFRQEPKEDITSGNDILEISEKGINHPLSYKDTGLMIISNDVWKNIQVMTKRIHRPSPLGVFSFASIIRQCLIFKNIKINKKDSISIDIKCFIGEGGDCIDANYPWELLNLNQYIIDDKISKIKLFDNKIKLIKNKTELIKFLGKEPIAIPENSAIRLDDKNILLIGPCYLADSIIIKNNTIIEKSYIGFNSTIDSNTCIYGSKLENAIIGKGVNIENGILVSCQLMDNSIVMNSFIGNKCFISNNVLISSSTLEANTEIHSNSIIEKSIIMNGTIVFHNCLAVMSIIGEHVMLGVGVSMPCKRLNAISEVECKDKQVTFFSDIDIQKTKNLGAIVGDYCQIGSGAVVHPGRRIGRRSKIGSCYQVVNNLPPLSDTDNP